MKKIILAASIAALSLSSCSTLYQTASQRDVTAPVIGATMADLEVSDKKITYTLIPTNRIRKGGEQNCIKTAISEALKEHGKGDVLIETQEAVLLRSGLLFPKIKSVTVTGYPATYKNFRSMDENTIKNAFINGRFETTNNGGSKKATTLFGFLK